MIIKVLNLGNFLWPDIKYLMKVLYLTNILNV